ncbi:hypothetical protein [Amycolatopsis sp. cmx-11-32]
MVVRHGLGVVVGSLADVVAPALLAWPMFDGCVQPTNAAPSITAMAV